MTNPEESLHFSIEVFEKACAALKSHGQSEPSYLLAVGLARMAEGLHAKIHKMETRLTAIEGVLRQSKPPRA